MSIVRGLRTEGIEVNCYTEAFERLQGIIPSSKITYRKGILYRQILAIHTDLAFHPVAMAICTLIM